MTAGVVVLVGAGGPRGPGASANAIFGGARPLKQSASVPALGTIHELGQKRLNIPGNATLERFVGDAQPQRAGRRRAMPRKKKKKILPLIQYRAPPPRRKRRGGPKLVQASRTSGSVMEEEEEEEQDSFAAVLSAPLRPQRLAENWTAMLRGEQAKATDQTTLFARGDGGDDPPVGRAVRRPLESAPGSGSDGFATRGVGSAPRKSHAAPRGGAATLSSRRRHREWNASPGGATFGARADRGPRRTRSWRSIGAARPTRKPPRPGKPTTRSTRIKRSWKRGD